MIRIMRAEDGAVPSTDNRLEELATLLENRSGMLWVDICGESPESLEPVLTGIFKFHPLAVEDALRENNLPKIDDWGEYVYIVMKSSQFDPDMDVFAMDKFGKIDIFKAKHLLVTHHREPIAAIDRVWNRMARHERSTGGASKILYQVLDGIADDYMLAMDKLDDAVDAVEDDIFERPNSELLEKLFALKRVALNLRRSLSPQREVLNKLARDRFASINPDNRIYYRDVYDHMVRLFELNESLRDLIGSAMDMHLSASSNRTNEIMKVLTVVTTLFVPLTFITGFWGMNFYEPAPNTTWCNPGVMWFTIALMLLLPISLLGWMRHRGWI